MITMYDVLAAGEAYIECALWSGLDYSRDPENPVAFDENYDHNDIHPDTQMFMLADVSEMIEIALRAHPEIDGLIDPGQFGHDFWLTRNGHGTGFWDRRNGDLGAWLTQQAEAFGEYDLYVGDDLMIHGE